MAFDASKLVSGFAKTAANIANKSVGNAKKIRNKIDENQLDAGSDHPILTALANSAAQKEIIPVDPGRTARWQVEQDDEKQRMLESSPGYHGDTLEKIQDKMTGSLNPEFVEEWENANDIENQEKQHQAEYEDWLDNRESSRPEYSKRILRQASMGTIADPEVPDSMLEGWDRGFGEYERRTTDMNKGWNIDWENLWMPASANITPEPVRNVYDDYFYNLDRHGIRDEDAISQTWENGGVDQNLIDDGYSPGSRESNLMTGEQYLRYINEIGIPGRDVRDIDPDRIYNKQSEQENYGFVPYITSEDSLRDYRAGASNQYVSNIFNNIANSRKFLSAHGVLPEYKLTYDGRDIDGYAFTDRAYIWSKTRPDVMDYEQLQPGQEVPEGSSPVSLYMRPEGGGKPISMTGYDDYTGTVYLEDGSSVPVDYFNEAGFADVSRPGDLVFGYTDDVPDLELKDGTVLKPYDVNAIIDGLETKDGSVSEDYGFLGLANPSPGTFTPAGIWDMMAQSAPYFHPATAIAKGIANSNVNGTGVNYMNDWQNDSYRLISEDPTREQVMSAAAGSMALPFTEMIWGPLGHSLTHMSPTRWIAQKAANKIGRLAGRSEPVMDDVMATSLPAAMAFGASDEGLEEIPGNIVENLQTSGLSDWYANRATDDEGNILPVDAMGRPVYEDTAWWERLLNFAKDAPEAYASGAVLGGLLGPLNLNEYRYRNLEERINAANKSDLEKPKGMEDLDARKTVQENMPALLSDYGRMSMENEDSNRSWLEDSNVIQPRHYGRRG